MNELLVRALVSILGGALVGGLTNTLAIWMLFHPYRAPSIGGRRLRLLQGVIPKSQPRLARAVGRTVGERLLTRDDMMLVLADPEYRRAFDEGLDGFLHDLLEVERPSVSEMLGPDLTARVVPVVEGVMDHLAARVERHVRSEAFAEAVQARAASLRDFLADQPVSDILTPDREAQIVTGAETWLDGATATDGFRDKVAEYVQEVAERLLVPDLTLRDMLPAGTVDAVEGGIAQLMPAAVERMAGALGDPAARERVERVVHDLLGTFLQRLRFHQRVVARMMLSGSAVDRVVDAIRVEGAERIVALVGDREVERAVAGSIGATLEELLDQPVTDLFGSPSDGAVADALEAVTGWLVEVVRDPSAQEFVRGRVQAAVRRASDQSWGELLEGLPPERAAEWVVAAARSELVGDACRRASRQLVTNLLERPVGRPARWLPAGGTAAIRDAVSEPLWDWLQAQVPAVVGRMDIAGRVEEKVRDFPVEKMERMVRRVTERELRFIVYLGYGLGALVGGVLLLLNQFV